MKKFLAAAAIALAAAAVAVPAASAQTLGSSSGSALVHSVVRHGSTWVVTVTEAGRWSFDADAVWRAARAKGLPADRNLREQLDCHTYFAKLVKRDYWLESSRPAVGLPLTVLTACNP